MTTNNRDEPDLRTPEENNSDKIKEGFADPAGEYPKKSYFFEPSINKAARSVERNELSIGGGLDGLSVDLPQQQESRYPYNRVMETASGHIIEFDDTPGGERILIKHNSGSGLELRSDGSTVMKTESNSVTSVAGSSALIVEGDANIKVNGNMSLSVAGDLNLDVGGNINTNVGGNKKETISGASRETIYGSKGSIVRENNSQTILGDQTSTVLGTNSNIVKGDNRLSVQGSSIFGVKGSFKQTSEGELVISSPNINMGADNLSVFGASGTIGGANLVHYGVTYYGTTFHGDLKGTAEFSLLTDEANFQNYPANDVGSKAGYSVTNDTTASASATSSTMDAYLNQSANGTIKIQIDEGDFLKNIIDRSDENDGVSEKHWIQEVFVQLFVIIEIYHLPNLLVMQFLEEFFLLHILTLYQKVLIEFQVKMLRPGYHLRESYLQLLELIVLKMIKIRTLEFSYLIQNTIQTILLVMFQLRVILN